MNRLADETSPYLRQHRDNPVDWFAWGDEAFTAARDRNVPILLSVGYSACHWCHVMAHECFEDDEVAAKMNELFVNVKVDREERPDVDAVYMDAVQAMTGRGGWPMTVFLTPQGEPFYGGTYFPKPAFLQLMGAIDEVYRTRPDDVRTNVAQLVGAISRSSALAAGDELPGPAHLNHAVQTLAGAFDPEWGGFGGAPKFPSTFNLELMLRAYMTTGADVAKDIVSTTLDAMASGGMYDHIGGGFARYSVDREWLVPHFEKMLYDQALLCRIYLHAVIVIGATQWRQVLVETIDYVLTTLQHSAGGFFSAEDADSPDEHGHGVEGLFHTWTPDEVRAALDGEDPDVVEATLDWYGITDDGNFEGRSIPNRLHARGRLQRPPGVAAATARLAAARDQRRRPGLDDKVITEWNALFLSTLAEAAAVFDDERWRDAAIRNGEFLRRELRRPDGRWHRSWHADGDPPARHDALAADHAALVDAFTRLAETTGQARWIDAAVEVADTMLDAFWDPEHGGLFTTAEDAERLVVRQKDLSDNATPSANSNAALALYRLAALTGEQRYSNHADRILQLLGTQFDDGVGMYSNALLATDLRRRGTTEVVIVGDRPDLVRMALTVWRPDVVLAWGEPYDSPLWEARPEGFAYICRDYACQAPQDTVEGFVEMLTGQRLPPRPDDS
ncbi:MAG: thioredoxin domain-containing protein [Ilumatobacter sp.]|nr:thioredoxin domain-containing protein [Ilumatobacter sp.]